MCVCVLKGKRLELLALKSLEIQSMIGRPVVDLYVDTTVVFSSFALLGLLVVFRRRSLVRLSVIRVLCKNGGSDRAAVWGGEWGERKE